MELHLALKEIVEKEGSNILTDPLLVNILADYNAYEKYPACKFILKSLIENNIVSDVKNFDAEHCNVELCMNNIVKKTCESFGFNNQLVSYVVKSLLYSLKLIDGISEVVEAVCSIDANMNLCNSNFNKHISFKGISFDNTIEDFVRELEKKGCSRSDVGINYIRGSFGRHEYCTFLIGYTCLSHKVWAVDVNIDISGGERRLTEEYEELLLLYAEKYGDYSTLHKDKEYISNLFKIPNGDINVVAYPENKNIRCAYYDNLNSELRDFEKKKQIMQDI